ncbi:type II toxin-antitoxin system RelE/ParE family toxin [Sphingomonas sp. T9W2]|uniref:type II toxin-antitoxin system RelE/ParE family toxin n=1 Tax=Sphingomonas sp. T9W2 TaxID=3143183 RepID=UPI0031F52483
MVWTRPALEDLRRINQWLPDNAAPIVASEILTAVRQRSAILNSFPNAGRPISGGSRVLRVRGAPYLLIYRTLPDQVEILRIRHDREDWDR